MKKESKESLIVLCKRQMKSATSLSIADHKDFLELGTKLWKRLKPIFLKLSAEMREKSEFKSSSIWILDDMPYNFVLCESLNNQTGELGFRIGMCGLGTYVEETVYLPKDVEIMDWEDIVKYAKLNDNAARIASPFERRRFW